MCILHNARPSKVTHLWMAAKGSAPKGSNCSSCHRKSGTDCDPAAAAPSFITKNSSAKDAPSFTTMCRGVLIFTCMQITGADYCKSVTASD